jgi:hypothetical protein
MTNRNRWGLGYLGVLVVAFGVASPGYAIDPVPDVQLSKKFTWEDGMWIGPPRGMCWETACEYGGACCRVVAK